MWKYFCSLAPVFVISTKCSDPWVLEFVVSSTIGNSLWEHCISLDLNVFSFERTTKSTKSTKIRTARLIFFLVLGLSILFIICIQCTPIILIIDVMICIYFVLIRTFSLCNLCNIGLENMVIIIIMISQNRIIFMLSLYIKYYLYSTINKVDGESVEIFKSL